MSHRYDELKSHPTIIAALATPRIEPHSQPDMQKETIIAAFYELWGSNGQDVMRNLIEVTATIQQHYLLNSLCCIDAIYGNAVSVLDLRSHADGTVPASLVIGPDANYPDVAVTTIADALKETYTLHNPEVVKKGTYSLYDLERFASGIIGLLRNFDMFEQMMVRLESDPEGANEEFAVLVGGWMFLHNVTHIPNMCDEANDSEYSFDEVLGGDLAGSTFTIQSLADIMKLLFKRDREPCVNLRF